MFLQEHLSYKNVHTISLSPLFAASPKIWEGLKRLYVCPPDGAGEGVGCVETGGAAGVVSVRGATYGTLGRCVTWPRLASLTSIPA